MAKKAESAVIVEKLSKTYEFTKKTRGVVGGLRSIINPEKETIKALKGINFKIDQGELVGFIGPNGAGKTTTLKILSGLLYPTAGFVQVAGSNPWKRSASFLREISIVFGQKNQLWWDLPASDSFELLKAIYSISDTEYKNNLSELTKLMDVDNLLDTQVRRLSLGQRMKLELIASLLHKPKILFLDEPTVGLDVIAQKKLRDFIYEYQKKNKATILLTSHNMNDVKDLVKRVIVISKGEMVYDGPLNELVSKYTKEKTITIFLSSHADVKKLEKLGEIKTLNLPKVVLSVKKEATAAVASEILQNFPVSDMTIEEEPIDSVIRRIFSK